MNRILSVISISLLLSQGSAAQTIRHLSMDEAVALSLSSSHQLASSRARILEATAAVREARDRRLPDVSVSGSYLRVAQPTIDLKVKLGAGSGGGEGASASPSVSQAMYGIANVSLPIFTGGQIKYGIQSAQYLLKATELDAAADRDDIIQNVVAAYVNLYKAAAAAQLVQENLQQANRRVTDFSNLEQNGLLPRNDLLKAQLQAGNVELSLLDAANNLELARTNMSLMLGLPDGTLIQTDSVIDYPASMRPLTEWQALALQNKPAIAAQQERIKAAETGVRATRASLYPSIALSGGYVAAYVPNFITITNALNGGVGLRYAPSNLWKGNATLTRAKARVQVANAGAAELEDAVKLQTAQAYEGYTLALKRIQVLQTATAQAEENFRIINNKYNNSLATPTELLEADLARLQASLSEAFAKADAGTAWHRLLIATHTETIGAGN